MFDKRSKRILMIFGFVVLVILITEITRPTPIDWRPSYTAADKIPFGSYVLFEELPEFYENTEIETVEQDPYVFLSEKPSEVNTAYIFINHYLEYDDLQIERLKDYVAEGNSVFTSARNFGFVFQDSLGFKADIVYSIEVRPSLLPMFFNERSDEDSLYVYDKVVEKSVFNKIDTLSTSALGYFRDETDPMNRLNFIRIDHGDGAFYIHTLPEAFSNYYMLKDEEEYAAKLLSFIDADKFYWDEYLKSGKKVITSPMRYVLNQKALTWAYYVLVISLILFVIFKAKREQRIIKVVEPLSNTSVEFSRTIGQMYFQHKDYGNIIAKKINYFMEIVRTRYFMNTAELNAEFIEKLALKSGNNVNKTEKLINLINHLKAKAMHTEADLIELNKQIEAFNF